jgi:hypothetical protein
MGRYGLWNMSEGIKPEAENTIERILENVKGQGNLLILKREECSTRGYHQIEKDSPMKHTPSEAYRFCYTCKSIFDKEDMSYQVKSV